MNFLCRFPDKPVLLRSAAGRTGECSYACNTSVQSPYSFSCFRDLNALFSQARSEGIQVLGISDLFTTDGFDRFHDGALENHIFPLFGIRLAGFVQELQKKGICLNERDISGKIILAGRGLDKAFALPSSWSDKYSAARDAEQNRMKEMIEMANRYFRGIGLDAEISYEEIRSSLSKKIVTVRHIARSIRIKIYRNSEDEKARLSLFRKLYAGKDPAARMGDEAAVENEIRSRLLRPGGGAWVDEDPEAALSLNEMVQIVLQAGGIPCYPILLDDTNNQACPFESNKTMLADFLLQHGIGCVEFTPSRNDLKMLTEYTRFFHEKGFLVIAGTGTQSPRISSLKVLGRNGLEIPTDLMALFREGACVLAAHQYLRARSQKSPLAGGGIITSETRTEMSRLGTAVIGYYLSQVPSGS